MKNSFLLIVLVGGLFLYTCRSNDNEPLPESEGTSGALDTLAGALRFHGGQRLTGTAPAGTSGSLKFSIKDTLHLNQGVYYPLKFLHDSTSDVTGVFIHVAGVANGSFSSFYFDVPEVPLDNDTISVVMIGFDPTKLPGFDPPLSFNIRITPHDEKGTPLDTGIIPVEAEMPHNNMDGSCGLTGGYWKWLFKYGELPGSDITPGFDFFNAPEKVWLRKGQLIEGCCCNDVSSYNIGCPCAEDGISNAILRFSTFERYKEETLTLFENGAFFRQTLLDAPYPDPTASDFCSNAGGVVHSDLSSTSYQGNWILTDRSVPQVLLDLGYSDKMKTVELDQTSQDPKGGGYGNGGGWIGTVDCRALVLVGVDPEGTGEVYWTIYERKSDFQEANEDDWYDIPES